MRVNYERPVTQPIYYAIGDIHGEAEKLLRLHSRIQRNHDVDFPGQAFILVHLGDYIDRGPDSFEVVDVLSKLEFATPAQFINLKGNHEQMMLDAYNEEQGIERAYSFWIRNGGDKTLASYRRAGFDKPPKRHIDWLTQLKTYHWDKTAKLIFVHAGIDPQNFPDDGEDRHLWTRSSQFFNTENWGDKLPNGTSVIHGHTPTEHGLPDIDGDFRRINIDTGACYGGDLTAIILAPDEPPRFVTS